MILLSRHSNQLSMPLMPNWLFIWKADKQEGVVEAKCRLIARRLKQREGKDFGEMFAPTVSRSYVRRLSVIACELDLDL